MTPQEVAQIYRACESFYGEKTVFWSEHISFSTIEKIINFYGSDEWGSWSDNYSTRQDERILAMLFYISAKGRL